VQADGIVKQFNWYPGIDPQYVQSKLTPAAWSKLFTDISPATSRSTASRSRCPSTSPTSSRGTSASSSSKWHRVESRASAALRRGTHDGTGADRAGARDRRRLLHHPARHLVRARFRAKDGAFTLAHFEKSFELYTTDLIFTLEIVLLSSALIAIVAVAIAGYLTLGENPRAVSFCAGSIAGRSSSRSSSRGR
jgi:hypothetical protein